MSSPHTRTAPAVLGRTGSPVLGLALGLITAATLAAPAALAAPVVAETTSPAPSPSGSATGSATGTTSTAAEGFRFWGFFDLKDGAWSFATTGPYQVVPADGAVQGWRYAVGTMEATRAPRATPAFAEICGKVAGEAGKKRVGVVIDYGRKADSATDANPLAPIARCALVPTGASSAEVLNAVASPREGGGMVCAIDNWPGSSGCSDPVAKISEEAKAADDKVDISVSAPREQPKTQDAGAPQQGDQGPSRSLLTGIAVVVVALAAAAAGLLRRRKRPADASVAAPERGSAAAVEPGDATDPSDPAGPGAPR